jgi:predicted TIM-barrel fold metal-dependent hydrolase
MLWRHPNVYGDISAYFPKSLDPELVRAMDRQLRHKVMLRTNGFPLERCLAELDELPLRDETKERIRGANAAEFLGLD